MLEFYKRGRKKEGNEGREGREISRELFLFLCILFIREGTNRINRN